MTKNIRIVGEITAEKFQQYLDQCDEGNIFPKVVISSPGGDIGYTLALLDDIDLNKYETFATGICQSAAAVLATAGEGLRTCTVDTLFRFVPPAPEKMIVDGQEVERVPDLRHFLHSVLVARLAQRLKQDKVEVYDLFDGQFISSTRARELGLIDEIVGLEEPRGDSSRFSGSEGKINCSDSACD